jgi:hypothetical protein
LGKHERNRLVDRDRSGMANLSRRRQSGAGVSHSGGRRAVTDGVEKVVFRLERDEVGWPPAAAEGVWAFAVGGGRYRLDNTPFFATAVSWTDVVRARRGSDGQLWVEGVERRGGHSTVRVIVRDRADLPRVRDDLIGLGCTVEGFEQIRLLAVDLPPEVDLAAIRAYLAGGQTAGRWGFEESDLSGHQAGHRAAQPKPPICVSAEKDP